MAKLKRYQTSAYKNQIKTAIAKIKKAKRIAIVSHVNPDGDTISCQLAIALALKGQGKTIALLNSNGLPDRFHYLPGSSKIKTSYKGKVDLAIAVDCGAPKRVGTFSNMFEEAPDSIQIDHHDFGQGFCHSGVIDHEASATAEIVYDMLKAMKVKITKPLGICLMTGIITDTASFHTSNTTPRSMRIAAELMECGVDLQDTGDKAFWKKSKPEMELSAVSMKNLHFEKKGQMVWSYVTLADFKKAKGKMEDVEEVPNELMGVEGVKLVVYMREMAGKQFRVSLRALPPINVAKVAQQFNGGGHSQAAGCNIKVSQKSALIKAAAKLLK